MIATNGNEVVVNGSKRFTYNHVFREENQPTIFETMGRPQLESLLEGKLSLNVTVLNCIHGIQHFIIRLWADWVG